MRRTAALVLMALVMALLPSRAVADTTVVIHGLDFPDDDSAAIARYGCDDLFDAAGAPPIPFDIEPGPDTPPAGTRSLGFLVSGSGIGWGTFHNVLSMEDTTVAGLSLHAAEGASGVAYAGYVEPDETATSLLWIGRVALTEPPGGWRTVDVAGLSYTWTKYDSATGDPVGSEPGTSTVAAFVAGHGGDSYGFYGIGFGCDGKVFYLDALRVGAPGSVTTYDLEAYLSEIAIAGSRSQVLAGKPVTLTGLLEQSDGDIPSGFLLSLEAKPFGADSFSEVRTALTGEEATPATATVRPRKNTTYRWRFAGSDVVEGSVSPTFTVKVRTALTLTLADGSLRVGDKLVALGRTTPAKPGFVVTLWRKTASGKVKIGAGLVRADGSFKVTTKAGKAGTWKVFATVPAGQGNLAGTSPTRTADVRR